MGTIPSVVTDAPKVRARGASLAPVDSKRPIFTRPRARSETLLTLGKCLNKLFRRKIPHESLAYCRVAVQGWPCRTDKRSHQEPRPKSSRAHSASLRLSKMHPLDYALKTALLSNSRRSYAGAKHTREAQKLSLRSNARHRSLGASRVGEAPPALGNPESPRSHCKLTGAGKHGNTGVAG